MKDMKTLGPKEAIHCPTPEIAKKIIELNGDDPHHYDLKLLGFCYIPKSKTYGSLKWHKECGYTIHPASDFLPSEENPIEQDIEQSANSIESIEQPLTEDQKFFRELVVSIAGEICTSSGSDWIEATLKTAQSLFTAVKQHEAK
jgi:hypothetical protein